MFVAVFSFSTPVKLDIPKEAPKNYFINAQRDILMERS